MPNELQPVVQDLLDAANKGDTACFLATFTEDGVVDDWGREFQGADAIEGWSDGEFIGKQVSLTVREAEQRGSETVITAMVGGAGSTAPATSPSRSPTTESPE